MLPTVLTNILCSLYKNEQRIAIVMDIHFKNNKLTQITYSNVAIKVSENYYHTSINTDNKYYKLLYKYTKLLFNTNRLIKSIENTHDVVSYLMMYMNYNTAKILSQNNCGVFRSLSINNTVIPNNIPNSLYKFIRVWNSSSGQYTLEKSKPHELLEFDSYIHITSPMRRLVDLLNIIKIQQIFKLYSFTDEAITFYNTWITKIDYINITTRSIRKIQLDCNLLHWCNTQDNLTQVIYEGYVFDKIERSDGLFQYMVFINEINMASRITIRHNLINYSKHNFTLHIFNKKDTFKKKVRLHLNE